MNLWQRLKYFFTKYLQAPGVGSACQLCGQIQGLKKDRGKEKPLPCGRGRIKKTGKDMAVQTVPVEVPKEVSFVGFFNPLPHNPQGSVLFFF